MSDRFHALPAAERTDPRHRRRHRRRTAAHARRGALRALIATHSALIVAAVVLLGIAGGGVAYAYWTAQATATAPPALRSGTLDLCVNVGPTYYGSTGWTMSAQGVGTGFTIPIAPNEGLFPGIPHAIGYYVINCGTATLTLADIEFWARDETTSGGDNLPYFTLGFYWDSGRAGPVDWGSTCTGTLATTTSGSTGTGLYRPSQATLAPGDDIGICIQIEMNDNAPNTVQGDQLQMGLTLSAVSVNPNP